MSAALVTARAVLGLPVLRRLVAAFLAFSIGEWASWIALVVFAYARGGPTEAGVVAGAVFVPAIVVAPAASLFGDRRPRATMLLAAYGIQCASMAATAMALTVAPPIVGYLAATAAATSITLARPAHAALLPEVVDTPDQLAIANAASGTVEGLGALIGPLVAGLLIAIAGPAAVYAGIAVLTLGASLAVLPIARGVRAGTPPAMASVPVRNLSRELGAGLRSIAADHRLLAVMAVLSGAIALLGAFNVLLTVIAVHLLGGDESWIGYLAALAGIGSVAGAGATGFLVGRERLAVAYVAAGGLFAAAVVVIGLGPSWVIVLAAVVAAGFGWAFVYVEAVTLAQRLAGDDVMSRVFGVMEATMMASQALGALFVPILITAFGPLGAISASGLVLGVVVLLAGPTLIAADRSAPERVRRLRALRAVPMFGPLSAPVLERLASGATVVEVPAGRRIMSEGETGDRFYVILQGEVEVANQTSVRRRLHAGESFGEIALLRDIPRTASVTAVGPAVLLALDRGAFLEALTGQPRSNALADAESRRRLEADAVVGGVSGS
jgi:MFS family permease